MTLSQSITLLLLPLTINFAAAQDYYPMANVTDWYTQVAGLVGSSHTWYYYSGDTTFNNNDYRKISFDSNGTDFHILYLREEAINKQVFRYIPGIDLEYVYYDFGLELGDQFEVLLGTNSLTYEVTHIDSVSTNLGFLKRWRFQHPTHLGFRYIESIGGSPIKYDDPLTFSDPVFFTECVFANCDRIFGPDDCAPRTEVLQFSVTDTICSDESIFGISTAGDHEVLLNSVDGCDTLINLTLAIYDDGDENCISSVGDCVGAFEICSSGLHEFSFSEGIGETADVVVNSSCLGGFGLDVESNSTWIKWKIKESGYTAFTISPIVETEDIDFVLYKANDNYDCDSLELIRCMGSGDFSFPSPCIGPTGLNLDSVDDMEPAGCNNPDQDNFLATVDVEAGDHYILFINQFSTSGIGFNFYYHGTGILLCDSIPAAPPEEPVATETVIKTTNLHPFPNPFNSKLIVPVSPTIQNSKIEILLFDTTGKMHSVTYSNRGDQLEVDLAHLVSGSYILQVVAPDSHFNYRVVKME